MPKAIPRVPIITDPDKWPARVQQHVFFSQPFAIPPELTSALIAWGQQIPQPGAGPQEEWWKDLSPYHKDLRGYTLVGQGRMPSGLLGPNETFRRGRKLAFDVETVLDGYQPFGTGDRDA